MFGGILNLLFGPLVVIALVVAAIMQGSRIGRLETRLGRLQHRLDELSGQSGSSTTAPPETPAPIPSVESAGVIPAPKTTAAPPPAMPPPPVPSRPPVWAAAPPADIPLPPPPVSSPPRRFEWERFVGLRLPIWLGAIALCIAGFFFVSYAIESGFFTPEMRVLSAAAASLAFLAAAEAVRRRVKTGNVAAIAAALAAAAIATAYATVYLASITYGLVPTGIGFVATIVVSLIAMAIALAFGQFVALIGVAGGYVAPAVFGGQGGSAAFLVVYVVALTAVAYLVIRWKSWWRIAFIGLIGPAFWGIVWAASPSLLAEAIWGDIFLIALPLIVLAVSWPGWQADGDIVGLRGFTAIRTPQRSALVGAVILSAIGFALFLFMAPGNFVSPYYDLLGRWTGGDVRYWEGFVIYGAVLVLVGFVSPPHRALQLPVLIAFAVALLVTRNPDPYVTSVATAGAAIVFGFGALDQFRRLREPALWATILSFVALYLFAIALFRITGWESALEHRHYWAAAALVLAVAFLGLLRYFGPMVAGGLPRSQVYAAWGGTVTTFVSLAVVLELDPLYFPAAAAVAILGLAAVHARVPVRGLRIVAAVYLVIYGLLLLGAFADSPAIGAYHRFIFAQGFAHHPLVLLVLPGIAIVGAATLFQRDARGSRLINLFDVIGIAALAIGLWFLFSPSVTIWAYGDMYVTGGKVAAAELALALAVVDLSHIQKRQVAYALGLVLAGVVVVAMFVAFLLPLLEFWPPFAVPGTAFFNIALLALGLPALLLFGIGWLVRQDARPQVRRYGIAVSTFAVLVTYAMLMVDIRQAYHLGQPTLAGVTSQSEFYAYSIGTLVFGIALLVIGLVFQHRGARALSLVFVLAATLKVFLFDAAELGGLWRVLSFLLMGLSFLGISWLYARFVFGIGVNRGTPPVGPPASPPAAGS